MYANTTLGHKTSLLRNNMSDSRTRNAAMKYHSRGWKITFCLPDNETYLSLSKHHQDKIVDALENLIIYYQIGGENQRYKVDVDYLKERSNLFPEGLQHMGDCLCWTYPLPVLDFPIPAVSLVKANTWAFPYYDGQ